MIRFAIFLIALSIAAPAFAHEHETVNGMSLLVHIAPDHNLIIGRESVINLSLNNKENTFSSEDCNCTLDIEKEGNVIQHSLLVPSKGEFSFAGIPVTVSEEGSYTFVVSGTPTPGGKFAPFRLEYTFATTSSLNTGAVAHTHNTSDHPFHAFHIILMGSAPVLAGINAIRIRYKEKRSVSKAF